jgi:hypothetical protein
VEEKKKDGRGGARPGAGRPRITKEESKERPRVGTRAWPEEWALIMRYVKAIRKEPALAEKAVERLEDQIEKKQEKEGEHGEKRR